MIEAYECTGCGAKGSRLSSDDLVIDGHRHLISRTEVVLPAIDDNGMLDLSKQRALTTIDEWCDGHWTRMAQP